MSNCCQMQSPFCCSLFRLQYGYLRAGCRVSRPKSALWKPFFHIANRLFNINAAQLTMLCKQTAVSHGLSRLSAAALPAGHTCSPQPHIFACPRRPAPRAPLAPSARAARIAPSCTVPPCTAPPSRAVCPRCPHRTILHRLPAPRAPPARSARAARIAPSCTVPPCTAPRASRTIPHRAQKAPGAFAPGAGCYGAAVPAHAPMSWQ